MDENLLYPDNHTINLDKLQFENVKFVYRKMEYSIGEILNMLREYEDDLK